MPSLTATLTASIAGIVLLPVLALAGLGSDTTCTLTSSPDSSVQTAWDTEQTTNAAVIVATGTNLGVNARGLQVAVAVAIQESSLRAVDHGDQAGPDSLGLFQQRSGWGSPADRMDPATATTLFFTGGHGGQPGLLDIPDWETLPLAEAANAVQHSAYPDAYTAHAREAANLIEAIASNGLVACRSTDPAAFGLPEDFTVPAGTSARVRVAIGWALAQLGTPYSYGGDCTDPHSGNPAHQCDCSSLVQQAYHTAGVSLPRVTSDQAHAGTAVNGTGSLRPGDLIFISGSDGTAAQPRHVGLYLGQGLIVHAPETGRDVEITRLSGWRNQIAAIRRPT